MKFRHFAIPVFLLILVGCSGIPATRETVLHYTSPPPTVLSTDAFGTPDASPVLEATPTASVNSLRIWLPPEFDPQANTPAGKLLRSRLNDFVARHPGLNLDVRVKAVEGTGSLLEALSTASAAAPQVLPDLIALPRPLLEAAALKGLLHPLDASTDVLNNAGWYEYARQLARLQNSTFGLPFAGDALILVYRPSEVKEPPRTWDEALKLMTPLTFPAADPQGLFTLALYGASGGLTQDDQGLPMLDPAILAQVLTFYQQAEQAGLAPSWLTLYENDAQSWDAYLNGQAQMAITMASRYLNEAPADSAFAPLPTVDGTPFTLATGWVWALSSSQPERQVLSIEMANFLTEGQFLAKWTQAAGYLPPFSEALDGWDDTTLYSQANQIIVSARIFPSADVQASLGPVLEQATLQIFKRQLSPQDAAQAAVDALNKP